MEEWEGRNCGMGEAQLRNGSAEKRPRTLRDDTLTAALKAPPNTFARSTFLRFCEWEAKGGDQLGRIGGALQWKGDGAPLCTVSQVIGRASSHMRA